MTVTLPRIASAPSTESVGVIRNWLVHVQRRRSEARLNSATKHLSNWLRRDIGLDPHPEDLGALLRRYYQP